MKPFADVLAGDVEEELEDEVREPLGVLLGDPLGEPLGVEESLSTNARFPFPSIFLFGPLVESREEFKSCNCVVDSLKDIVFLNLVEAEWSNRAGPEVATFCSTGVKP